MSTLYCTVCVTRGHSGDNRILLVGGESVCAEHHKGRREELVAAAKREAKALVDGALAPQQED